MNCDKHEILQEPLTELTTLVDIDSTQLSPIAVKSNYRYYDSTVFNHYQITYLNCVRIKTCSLLFCTNLLEKLV